MAGAKLQAVKETTKFLVQQLSVQDKLSVVSFENDVSEAAPARPAVAALDCNETTPGLHYTSLCLCRSSLLCRLTSTLVCAK